MKKLLIAASQYSMLLANVMAIEEAKDLASLSLDELIGNLKVYEMVLDNDGVGSKTTKEKVKCLALKAKVTREETSDDNDRVIGSDVEIDLAIVVIDSEKTVKAEGEQGFYGRIMEQSDSEM
ncbi:hypothetical protein Tco_0658522 [Tanacetum coccineum]